MLQTRSGTAPRTRGSMIYDEIEALTRKVAIKTHNKGYCTKFLKNPEDLERKMSWATLLKYLRDGLDRSAVKADGKDLDSLSEVMLNRIIGITPHRNESSHKPSSLKTLSERDSRLRTRMEAAIDILTELIAATKCLRV